MRQFLAQRGYLTFAIGQQYLDHARMQAMTIKLTQATVTNYAVVIDEDSAKQITSEDRLLFDSITVIPHRASSWDMTQEWRAFDLTPWRETIKTDADMVFTASIDHWWTALQHRDICLTDKVQDFRHESIRSRYHRQLFDINLLPNVYSALTFFRYSKLANDFFKTAGQITADWDWFATDNLIKNEDMRPRTDEIYALAARLIGSESCTWPAAIPTFVHMKERLNGLSTASPWYKQIANYWRGSKLFVGNVQQKLPFHYHQKGWIDEGTYASIHRDYGKFLQSSGDVKRDATSADRNDHQADI